MSEKILWIGCIGLIISMISLCASFIHITILLNKKPTNIKKHTSTKINTIELSFICSCIFMIITIIAAFYSSELGQIIFN